MTARWERLGTPAPTALTEARLDLHWAAQLVSAAGSTLLAPRDDFAHTTVHWRESGELSGEALADGRRVTLDARELSLAVTSADDPQAAKMAAKMGEALDLRGRTLAQALDWLGAELGAPVSLPDHDLPRHAVQAGAAFGQGDPEARSEVARWFDNAAARIEAQRAGQPNATRLRCWPHHFDVATLITLDPATSAEEARSLGIGFSPGDSSYDEPYFYVTPWPYPCDEVALPDLVAGQWHRQGFTAAVLLGTELCALPASEQARAADTFLAGAIRACLDVL